MRLDPLSPIAPARVRILLLPIGRIKRARFLSFVDRLRPENVVRLGDISPDGRPNRNMFSPLAFPAGMIVYELTTSLPPPSHLSLSPFELYREPLVIIAIADGAELANSLGNDPSALKSNGHDSQAQLRSFRELDQELEAVRDDHPKALVHQLLIFDYLHTSSTIKLPEGLIAIPPLEVSKVTTMKTVMCDISSMLLAEMTTLAKSLQGITMIESPNAVQRGNPYSSLSRPVPLSRNNSQHSQPDRDSGRNSPAGTSSRSHSRMSMPPQLSKSTSDVTGMNSPSRPSTPMNGSMTPTDEAVRSKSPENAALARVTATGSLRDHSRDRISVQGFGHNSESSRNKAKGRTAVVIGALHLQAGRWLDALKESVEGATVAKLNNDHLWHAKALENILVAMVMLAWAGLDFQIPQVCYSAADIAPYHVPAISSSEQKTPARSRLVSLLNLGNLLPELLDKILNLYERAANRSGESMPQIAFSEVAIRFSKLLTAIHLCGGKFDDDPLQIIVMGSPMPHIDIGTPRLNVSPPRTLIAASLFRAFPSSASVENMTIIDRVDRAIIYSGMASILGSLGYERKKAMVMRELVSVLIPGLIQARMIGAAEIGIHPAAGLASLGAANGNANGVSAFELGEEDVESGIDDLLSLMGRTYGVVSFEPLVANATLDKESVPFEDSDEAVINRILNNATARAFGGQNLKMNVLRACINLAEALPDFHGVMKFSADLLRTAGTGVAPGPRSEDASPLMTREEQVRLGQNIVRTFDAAKKLGVRNPEAEYWDEFLVRGVDFEPPPSHRTPTPHRKTELVDTAATESKERNPFIYNPFLKRPDNSAADPLLVAGESAGFKVTLQNPYEFDIEIESIRLESDSIDFNSAIQRTVIGPYRTQTISISGTPGSAGSLSIKGCIAKVKGCRERRFPIFKDPWTPQAELKIKKVGLLVLRKSATRPTSVSSVQRLQIAQSGAPTPCSLTFKVIQKQPMVVVKSSTLSQSAIMVLEGERQKFSITLQNLSTTTPTDLILFSFQDSTQSPLQSALSNRDASPAELYEYELILSKKQAFRYLKSGDESPYIKPGDSTSFDFEVLGKPGLTNGTIQVDYACTGVPATELPDTFHTRQVRLPLTVTVNAGVELSRMDVLPLAGDVPSHLWPGFATITSENEILNPSDYCLLVLDLRNAWPSHLRVHLEIAGRKDIDEDILPGNSSRIIFPIKRIFLKDPFASIPTLDPARQRQFVVSTGKISADAERSNREAFWYREEILKTIRGRWTTISGPERTGTIELRGIRLLPRMIDAIKIEDVGVELSLEDDHTGDYSGKRNIVEVDQFLRLRAHIINRTAEPIYPMIRIQPSLRNQPHNQALDLSKKLVWDGTLQRTLPLLPANGTLDVTVGITALCRGEFEISASVEEARLIGVENEAPIEEGRPRANTRAMMDALLGVRERRIWHTREPCLLIVTDDEGDEYM